MRRIAKLIIFFVFLFLIFLYFYFRKVNYESNYQIDDFNVKEIYNKKTKKYYITIKKDDIVFSYVTLDKYSHKRNLITNIISYEKEGNFCIDVKSSLSLYPVCQKNNEIISAFLFNQDKNENILETFENINVYDYLNKTYLLWNYHNFLYLNKENEKKYEILDKDIYNLRLVYATNRYLLIPDQTNEFTFSKISVIDTLKNKKKDYNLEKEIYFDSYYLGDYKNKVYLVDRKNTQEYEINLVKGKLDKIEGKILNDNKKWENVSINKLIHQDYTFKKEDLINYELKDNTLYANIENNKIKVSNRKVRTIVKSENENVFFIADNSLYYFNLYSGEKKLLSYNEWDFNYNNMIYIFD